MLPRFRVRWPAVVLGLFGLSGAVLLAPAEGYDHPSSRTGGDPSDSPGSRLVAGTDRLKIGGRPHLGPAYLDQRRPQVCFGGDEYMIAWQDRGIRAARLTRAGALLDSTPIALLPACGALLTVLFDGAAFHVIGSADAACRVMRITPDGSELDAQPRELPAGDAVILQGADYAIARATGVWTCVGVPPGNLQCSPWGGVTFLRVRSGDPGGERDTVLVRGSVAAGEAAVAAGGSNCFVAWREDPYFCAPGGAPRCQSSIRGARISVEGALLDTAGLTLAFGSGSSRPGHPRVAFASGTFLVVWQQGFETGGGMLSAVRVSEDGTIMGTVPLPSAAAAEGNFALASNGSQFLLVWAGAGGLFSIRIDPSGAWIDPEPVSLGGEGNMEAAPAAALGPDACLVAWEDRRAHTSDIYCTRVVAGSGALSPDGALVSWSANGQTDPHAAFDGTNYLVAWEDHGAGAPRIFGARVTPGSSILDPMGLLLSEAPGGNYTPRVSPSNGGHLVLWTTDTFGFVAAARVGRDGDVLPSGLTGTILVSNFFPAVAPPEIAFLEPYHLIVWNGFGISDGTTRSGTFCSRLLSDGSPAETTMVDGPVLARARLLSAGLREHPCQGVTACRDHWLVVWTVGPSERDQEDIRAARIDTSGVLLDPDGIVLCATPGARWSPAVASDGERSLVVWVESRGGVPGLHATRVDGTGAVLDPLGIQIAASVPRTTSPVVVHDGNDFVVAWQDDSDEVPTSWSAGVTVSGTVLPRERIVGTNPGGEAIALCHGPATQVLATFHLEDQALGVPRVSGCFALGEPTARSPGLSSGFPNPFSEAVEVLLTLPEAGRVAVDVYDVTGRRVRTVLEGDLRRGTHRVRWDGMTESGQRPAAGLYFVMARSGAVVASRKVVLVR